MTLCHRTVHFKRFKTVYFVYVLPPYKSNLKVPKVYGTLATGQVLGWLRTKPEVSPSRAAPPRPPRAQPRRKHPQHGLPSPSPPSLLSSLLVHFFKLKQILPSALLICFHVKKKRNKMC